MILEDTAISKSSLLRPTMKVRLTQFYRPFTSEIEFALKKKEDSSYGYEEWLCYRILYIWQG